MTVHAWIVEATGLPEGFVFRGYQNSGHEPPDTVDHVTYFEADRQRQTYVYTERAVDEDIEDPPVPPVSDDFTITRSSESKITYTLRVFGPNRAGICLRITQGGRESGPRQALRPAVFQRVTSDPRPVREERAKGWIEYLSVNVLIFEMETTVETVPAIHASEITGEVGGVEVEVIEP